MNLKKKVRTEMLIEFKDWLADLGNKPYGSKNFNRALCFRYFFLIPTDWYGNEIKDYDYESTWFDDVEPGWRKIFLEMCEKIQNVLDYSYNEVDDKFKFVQIKEKFGELRMYADGMNDEIYNIIEDCSKKSRLICCECGAPAKWQTTDWIRPYCDSCVPIKKDGTKYDAIPIKKGIYD